MSIMIALYLAFSFVNFCFAIASQDIPRFKWNIFVDLIVISIFGYYDSFFTNSACPFALAVLVLDIAGYALLKADSR